MAKPRVFVTRVIPEAGLRLIRERCEAEVWPGDEPPSRQDMLSRAPEVEGILSMLTERIDAELLDAAPKLRVVSNYAVGFDNIDLAAASARGIPVGNTPGVLTETTADLAFALLLGVARLLVPGVDYVKAGKWGPWHPMVLRGMDVHHATLGIVGLGRIGAEVAKRAHGFDMNVIYFSRTRKPDLERELGLEYRDSLEGVLRESDFVSLHTPLTPDTRHLMNARTLALMKPTAILINTTRGPVVDPDALYEALKANIIWAAGLDVTDPEPLPAEHRLLTLENCVVLPHIGSASIGSRDAMAALAAENLIAGLEGRPLKASPNPDVRPRP